MAPNSPRTRIPAALAMLGGALWAASWSFNSFTEDGTRAVLGLSERGWRRLLDPALACLIVALVAYKRRYAWPGSRAAVFGWSTATLGLVAMLVGNVIEFWIGELLYVNVPGQFKPSDHVGWALFLAGLMILSGGFVVLGVVHFRSRLVPGWRRGLPLLMGLLPLWCYSWRPSRKLRLRRSFSFSSLLWDGSCSVLICGQARDAPPNMPLQPTSGAGQR